MSGVVFIYAREDAFEAQQRARDLEYSAYPVEVRISLGFGPEAFGEQISSMIDTATAVIVLWSVYSIQNAVIRKYADLAAQKENLVSVLSQNLPPLPVIEGKPPTSRHTHYDIPTSKAAALFPPWLTADQPAYGRVPPPAPAAASINRVMLLEGWMGERVLFYLPGIIIVGSVIWGVTRDALSLELVGWAVLSAALVNLLRGLRA